MNNLAVGLTRLTSSSRMTLKPASRKYASTSARLRLSSPRTTSGIRQMSPRRPYATTPPPPPPPPAQPSAHASFYTTLLPATIPILLLGSAIYLGLELWRVRLAHEKFMWEAEEKVKALEEEVNRLAEAQKNGAGAATTSATATASARRWFW